MEIAMTRFVLLFTLVSALVCSAATADDEAAKEAIRKDRKLYEGTWRVTSLVVNGVKAEEADARKITVANNADGTWIIKVDGKQITYGTSTFDPRKKPKHIDFVPSDGDNQGQTHLGIYEIEGDKRKLCFANPGKDRPKEFKSESGDDHILVTFERVKAK
jgi:uncharacterized protein (TIGR03067 family)